MGSPGEGGPPGAPPLGAPEGRSPRGVIWAVIGGIIILVFIVVSVLLMVRRAGGPAPRSPEGGVGPAPTATPVATPEETPPVTETTIDQLPAAPAAAGAYQHPDGFQLVPPAGWLVDDTGALGTKVIFRSPTTGATDGAAFAANINVTVNPVEAGATLETLVNESMQLLPQVLSGYTLIDDARVVTASGHPAHILGGTFTQGTFNLRNKQLLVLKDGKSYTITGTALAAAWDAGNYNALFDSALTSLVVP